MKTLTKLIMTLFLLAIAASGCGGGGSPELIASYPKGGDKPREITSGQVGWVSSGFLGIRVEELGSAESEIRSLASQYGAYVIDTQTWDDDDFQNRILVLTVAHSDFYRLMDKIKQVGDVESEHVTLTSKTKGGGISSQIVDSTLTVHLYSEKPFWPKINISGWRPAETLSKAFSVFLSIFGFIVDVLIWVIVVLGPFALIGFGAWKMFRKYEDKRQSK